MASKGKGREPESPEDIKPSPTDSTPSFLDRLGSSAAGLARDVVTSAPSQANSELSNALAAGDKRTSAGSSTRLLERTLETQGGQSSASFSSQATPGHVGFRNEKRIETDNEPVLDQWSTGPANPFIDQSGVLLEREAHLGLPQSKAMPTQNHNMTAAWSSSQPEISKQQHDGMIDGVEVVNILSDPSFQPQFWEASSMNEDEEIFRISKKEKDIADLFLRNPQGELNVAFKALLAHELGCKIQHQTCSLSVSNVRYNLIHLQNLGTIL